jgi:hypothetical protein
MARLDHDPISDSAARPEIAHEIDVLMAGPIRPRPAVIVVGDDVVASFTPAPPPVRSELTAKFAAQ